MMGDTGGVKSPQPQQIVAAAMEKDFNAPAGDRPSFLYLLGDVIYFYGKRSEYYPQLYEPYAIYPAPIMAIPGNHDGDPAADGEPSLAAFVDNFCSKLSRRPIEAQETHRDTMIQPNVFWTLRAPFLTIIGLYYQRFTRPLGGRPVPYVVAGAGGYWHLHAMARDDTGQPLPKPWPVPSTDLTLENYVANRHGYLRLTASSDALRGEYVTVPRPQESWDKGPITVADSFTINLRR